MKIKPANFNLRNAAKQIACWRRSLGKRGEIGQAEPGGNKSTKNVVGSVDLFPPRCACPISPRLPTERLQQATQQTTTCESRSFDTRGMVTINGLMWRTCTY